MGCNPGPRGACREREASMRRLSSCAWLDTRSRTESFGKGRNDDRADELSRPRSLCCNRDAVRPIERETAWKLYRNNWRFVWQDDLTDDDRALIESLEAEFGNEERLLGTDCCPRREITPEEAAEILGIEVVLLVRRIEAGALPCRKIDGQITFNLMDLLDLKRREDARNSLLAEINEAMEGS